MIAIPAVDLQEGACVQPVGDSPAGARVRLPSPVGVAANWAQMGFHRLHVVDLDAAMGLGSNLPIVEDLLRESDASVQVGGGIQSAELVEQLFRAGADRVVVGARALEEPDWLAHLADLYPGVIIVSTDVRERRVTTRGWVRILPHDILDVVEELNALPLAGLLVTATHREGQLQGPDLALMEDVAEASHAPVIASGGISSVNDLRALEHRGVSAAVVGTALYTGVLDPRIVAQEFAE